MIAITKTIAEEIEEKYKRKVNVIPNGVVLSTFLCKISISPFFKEWQVITHFSYRV